ncbi:response regulator [Microvirga yunnanensis]|nr:response regulator [Microvirga sp. HBU67655]
MIPLSSGMASPKHDSRPLILVVEDEALVRMTLVDVLEDAGFKVIEAVHADEALQVLKAVSDIQGMVTDVEMPRGSINGFELARQVRASRHEIGVLIVSGRAAPKSGELPEGALFIGKPVHPETLVRLLKGTLVSKDT